MVPTAWRRIALERVVISSTNRDKNAYASVQGAYLSDAFFSCIAGSHDLKTCYNQARAAVTMTGNQQTPWIDDNGDGISSPLDGAIAQSRYVTHFFGASPPEIVSASVTVASGSGTLEAEVEAGSEEIGLVWAAVYAPSFQEPTETSLELGAPLLRLEAEPGEDGQYRVSYPGGFQESGQYRVVFYAQDKAENYAQPKLALTGGATLYLPLTLGAR
jgi:hypothetical protein